MNYYKNRVDVETITIAVYNANIVFYFVIYYIWCMSDSMAGKKKKKKTASQHIITPYYVSCTGGQLKYSAMHITW